MIVNSIELHNFLCYYGKNNKIVFVEGLNLILGPNGYGKSKLYDAFQWVFKNGISDESNIGRLKSTEQVKKALVSDKALIEASVGEKICCEVIIEVSSARETYQLRRKYYVVKQSDKDFLEAKSSSLEVYYKDIIDFKPLDESRAVEIAEKIIPDEVMPYVWFQGERGVNSIIDTSSSGSLKRVIQRLSDIEKWEDYIVISEKAFTTAKNQFNHLLKDSKSNKSDYEELIKAQKRTEDSLEVLQEKMQNAKANLEAATEKSSNVIGKLSSAKKIEELRRKKQESGKELGKVIEGIENFHMHFTQNLFKEYWLLMDMYPLVEKFEQKYKEYTDFISIRKTAEAMAKGEQNRLPRGIPERMQVQKMLDKERCLVCDRPALKGSPEYKAIEQLLPELNSTQFSKPDIEFDLRRLWNTGFNISDKFRKADTEILQVINNRDTLIEKQKILKEEITKIESDINNEILNSGVEEAMDIIAMANQSNQDIQSYSFKVGKLSKDIETEENKIKSIENKLKKLSIGDVDPAVVKKLELLEDLVSLTKKVKEKEYKSLIELLERTANEHYENINRPTGAFYGKIKFIETTGGGFTPEIFNDNGERVNNLNTSQTSSLKLSIIMAIVTANESRNYALKYPLISDAPISDFDAVKSKSFLKEAARTFNQSILIIKDYLEEDVARLSRYKPDISVLKELSQSISEDEKKINVVQLDIPDGIDVSKRENLTIEIKTVNIV